MNAEKSGGEIAKRSARTFAPSIAHEDDQAPHPSQPGIGLALSGGGYRAMLFHTGALMRINDAGLLKEIRHVSSVSGGSMTAAILAKNWGRLTFDSNGVATNFEEEVVAPLLRLSRWPLDGPALLLGLPRLLTGLPLSPSAPRWVAWMLRLGPIGNLRLGDLPDSPVFEFNATSLQTKVRWAFTKTRIGDYRVGHANTPRMPVATAVAASAAFPMLLAPLILRFGKRLRGHTRVPNEMHRRAVLTDGGAYDNLGLQPLYDYDIMLVSDGGSPTKDQAHPKGQLFFQTLRVISVIDHQVRSLRKSGLLRRFKARRRRKGTYWSTRSHVADYKLADPLEMPDEEIEYGATTRTRLWTMRRRRQRALINWGYIMADTAIRKHVKPGLRRPVGLPWPEGQRGPIRPGKM
jgi:NTE family protein